MSVTDGIGQTPCSLEHYLVKQCFCCVFEVVACVYEC